MKKVLIFSLNYYPYVGGAEVAIKEITDRISPEEIEFHLIANRFDSNLKVEEKIGNVFIHRVGKGTPNLKIEDTFTTRSYIAKVLYIPRAFIRARALHKTEHFDLFWAMMSYMVFPISLVRLFGNRTPYLITLQEGDPFEHVFNRPHIKLFKPLLTHAFKNARGIQAISSFLLSWSKDMGFRGDARVIPNAVDTKKFSHPYTESEIIEMKKTLGKKEGEIFLVTTSRLVHKNAVDDVITALSLLPENISFLIYGSGPDEAILKALALKLGVEDRARFMGHIDQSDMPLMLSACDIFIRPSRSEGMGNSFVEAMAVGLPVIATQEGGIADFLYDAKRNPEKETTGWAVEVNSPKQIAEAVEKIVANPTTTHQVTKRAKAMVAERYEWGTTAKEMKKFFDELM